MLTKNNWIQTSLGDRVHNKEAIFTVSMTPYAFKEVSFADASISVCRDIQKLSNKLFLALSGGLDSEYILRLFHKLDIPITPIIVCCGNEEETEQAIRVCTELNIIPRVILLDEKQLLSYFKKYISDHLGGIGYNSSQLIVAKELAIREGGLLVVGNHIIGESTDIIEDDDFVYMAEWDLYAEYSFGMDNVINFFLHTPEIVYSMLPDVTRTGEEWQAYRCHLYQIPYRPKIRAKYSPEFMAAVSRLTHGQPNSFVSWSRSEMAVLFRPYIR